MTGSDIEQHVVVIRSGATHTRVRVVGPFSTKQAVDEWVDAHASRNDKSTIYTGVMLTAPEHVNQYDQGNCGPNAERSEHKFVVASRYIESIRNPAKREFARDYYQHIRAGRSGPCPKCPELSCMAEQVVRMQLDEIMG